VQDEYSIFQRQYAVGMHGYALVYAVTSKTSFEMTKIINDKILNALGTDVVPRVLVGNKKDLIYERQVSTEDGKALAQKWGCRFVETSARHNENISEVFTLLIEEIQKDTMPEEPPSNCILL
jgi:Ras homolog enriched in brain